MESCWSKGNASLPGVGILSLTPGWGGRVGRGGVVGGGAGLGTFRFFWALGTKDPAM